IAKDLLQFMTRDAAQKICRGFAAGRIHAHVERPLGPEREAALGPVELRRADAQIDHETIDRHCAERAQNRGCFGEVAVNQRDAVADRRQPLSRRLDGARIAVDADQARVGGLENARSMSAAAHRGVAIHPARARREPAHYLVGHHRLVLESLLPGTPPSRTRFGRPPQRVLSQISTYSKPPTQSTSRVSPAKSRKVGGMPIRPCLSMTHSAASATRRCFKRMVSGSNGGRVRTYSINRFHSSTG